MSSQGEYLSQLQQLNGADMMNDQTYREAHKPYRWAGLLQEAVIAYCDGLPYTVGLSDREDIATDLINEKVEQNGLTAEEGGVYLSYWRRVYGAK